MNRLPSAQQIKLRSCLTFNSTVSQNGLAIINLIENRHIHGLKLLIEEEDSEDRVTHPLFSHSDTIQI